MTVTTPQSSTDDPLNDDLLKSVLSAHGGLDRWSKVKTLTAEASYGGPFWEFKGQGDLLGNEDIVLDAQRELITLTNASKGFRVIEFDKSADRIRIVNGDGTVAEELYNPRASFPGYTSQSKWDRLQAAYFISYATWHYLTEPYLFTYPGVTATELEPWQEGPQTWRRLRVTFPPTIDTHSAFETYYFDEKFRQRRMDYEPEINGGAQIAHYTFAQEDFDGFLFPTQRRIFPRRPDGSADMDVARITIDLSNIQTQMTEGETR